FPSVTGTGFAYPPELYPAWPTRPSLMNSGDAIHLNASGYNIVSLYGVQQFFNSALQSATLAVNDTDLAFGNVRVGTSASHGVTASNAGPNYTKVQNLTFSVATGAFSGGGQSFNPLFKDPTLGSDTASINYVFAPTVRGTVNQITSATSTSNNQNMLLSGKGVGPVFTSVPSVTLNPVSAGAVVAQNVNVLNSTSDGDLGALTNMTLVSASITGPDAGRFSLPNFTPGTVITAGGIQGNLLQFSAVGAAAGSYNATLTFTTDVGTALGAAGTQYSIPLTAVVVAVPPVVNSGGPYNGSEGSNVLLSASGTGDISAYAWDLDNNGSYETAGQNVNFLPLDNGVYTVGVQATGPGGSSTTTTTVTVANVAPTAGVTGPTSLLRGASHDFTLSASDDSSVDQAAGFTYTIDWNGDGSDVEVVNGATGLVVSHTFDTVGARTIKVTATDKDSGASNESTLAVSVSAAQLVENDGLFDLVWTGTAGADHVQFEQLSPTSVRITTTLENGLATNFVETFNGVTGRVEATGQDGDDVLDAVALATISATLDGGAGSNTLYGGEANDILIGGANFAPNANGPEGQQGNNIVVGGAGDDTIYGNAINGAEGKGGHNILLGGAGHDTIFGNWSDGGEGGGRNILVGGADVDTLYDYKLADGAEGRGSILIADETSLSLTELGAVRSEWTSNRSYQQRVDNIAGNAGGGNNGSVYLQAGSTVATDGAAADALWGSTGGSGLNWFWYVLAVDSVNRTKSGETLSTI
ncbi:MAG: beta strand repeat-containing protein, partial [Pirellulales bacterium]